jgi:hypothetical protein
MNLSRRSLVGVKQGIKSCNAINFGGSNVEALRNIVNCTAADIANTIVDTVQGRQ